MSRKIQDLQSFREYLVSCERAENTINKYCRDVSEFLAFVGDADYLTQDIILGYKHFLKSGKLTPGSANTKICSVNAFLNFKRRPDLKLKLFKIQRRAFRDSGRDLTARDYKKLLDTAYAMRKQRLGLILETIGQTGMRVSELACLDIESIKQRRLLINLKSKYREIFLPKKLCRKLLDYARECKIKTGPVFLTKNGTCVSRKQVWSELKKLAQAAGVLLSKVFPHNIRHLFARTFYRLSKCDIVKLADVLGHSSIDTTRIYLVSTGAEHLNLLNKLDMTLCS